MFIIGLIIKDLRPQFNVKKPSKMLLLEVPFQPKAKEDQDMPDLKLGRHKIRQFKREDIVLHLYQEEIEELATRACNGNRGGFKWINERSAIIENKFKCGTQDAFTEEEIRKIDNKVQQWNERELPASIQAKYISYLFLF